MKYGTVINCIDGRVQYPVLDYLNKNYDVEFFDAANEVGPLRILTERTDNCRLFSLKEQIIYVGLYVNDRWEVEEYTRIEP